MASFSQLSGITDSATRLAAVSPAASKATTQERGAKNDVDRWLIDELFLCVFPSISRARLRTIVNDVRRQVRNDVTT